MIAEWSCAFHCVGFLPFVFSTCVFDKIYVVWVFDTRAFPQEYLSFGFWVSAYVLPDDSLDRVLLNLTNAHCRFACMFRDALLLREYYTGDIGSQRLVNGFSLCFPRIGLNRR